MKERQTPEERVAKRRGTVGAHLSPIARLMPALIAILLPSLVYADAQPGHMTKAAPVAQVASAPESVVYPPMAGPGKKVPIGADHYLVYGFDKRPKLGMVIMKVDIFDAKGAKETSFEVKADAGMPSMKGAHETGERLFALSKKGDYLLPINIVMPGGWEVRMAVLKEGKTIFRGSYQFDV